MPVSQLPRYSHPATVRRSMPGPSCCERLPTTTAALDVWILESAGREPYKRTYMDACFHLHSERALVARNEKSLMWRTRALASPNRAKLQATSKHAKEPAVHLQHTSAHNPTGIADIIDCKELSPPKILMQHEKGAKDTPGFKVKSQKG
jgi:hypothetical protein